MKGFAYPELPAGADGTQAGSAVVSRLTHYRLEERIGAGGMAVVFRAHDERLGRRVALKVLAPALAADDAFRRRFIRESLAAAAVDDPHIIPVFEASEAGGVLFIAMRYVAGGDARSMVRRAGPLSPGRALAIISPVASALDAAHAAGLVHRDVKLANMLVDTWPGRPDHVYLSDFGLSKRATSSPGPTLSGQFIGTPGYSAPEQLAGKSVDGRADQYSLACAAFELLCGETPFPRDQVAAVIWAHMSEPPPALTSRRPDLPRAVDGVFAKALAKTAPDRYPSCRAFADALREALGAAPYNSGSENAVRPPYPGSATARVAGSSAVTEKLPVIAGSTLIDAAPGPESRSGRRGRNRARRRALVIAAVASLVLAGGSGTVLAVHLLLRPPVLGPTGLAVQGRTTSSLTIEWSGPATGPPPDTYQIVRDGTVIGTVSGTARHYTDGGLTPGSLYHYQVIAVRGGERSPISRPLTGETALLRPTGLAVHGRTTSSLTIEWSGPTTGPPPDTYQIVRDDIVVGTVPGTARSYTDGGLISDSPYHYQVIAVSGGEQSPISAPLTGQTAALPLSEARLDWNDNVTYTMERLSPADSNSDKQPGDSWRDFWIFTPKCSSGPCDATLDGEYDKYSFTSTLTRSGATYSGTAEIKGYWQCDTPSNPITGTMTITITVKSAALQGTEWAMKSFSGTATLYFPAKYSCHSDTAELALKGG